MYNTNSAPYDEPSWGQTIQNYRKETNSLPWNGKAEFVPTKRETVYEKSRQERQFNPITMKYRDEYKETMVQERERAFAAVRLNDAKDKQLCFEQKFNIINHQSHLPKEYEDKNKKTAMMNEVARRAPDSRVKYNIISHMGRDEHLKAKMVPREGEEFTLRRSMNVTLEGGLKPKSHQTREFDVLTNKYLENHTAREVEDLEVQRDTLAQKYWKSHDYDILAGRYCDGQKEMKYQQDIKMKEKGWGKNKMKSLPTAIKYSEGNVYDILTNEIKDGRAIAAVDEKRNKSIASKMGSKIEEQIRTKATEEDDRLETMAHNRIHPYRFKEERRYGFDPITNISYKGRTGVSPAPLRQEEPKPVWARLHGGGNMGYGGGGRGSGGVAAKPRDLSGADAAGERKERMYSARRELGNSTMNSTQKPDFVPSLTIPAEGMVDGRLRTGGGN